MKAIEKTRRAAKAAKETGEMATKAILPDRRPWWKKFAQNHPVTTVAAGLIAVGAAYRKAKVQM